METHEERVAVFERNAFFQQHGGLAEALVEFEERTGLKLPSEFVIPPFIHYEIGENLVILGKVHTGFLFGMRNNGIMTYRLFENKAALKLFFAQMAGLEREDMAFWLKEVEEVELNIRDLLRQQESEDAKG